MRPLVQTCEECEKSQVVMVHLDDYSNRITKEYYVCDDCECVKSEYDDCPPAFYDEEEVYD